MAEIEPFPIHSEIEQQCRCLNVIAGLLDRTVREDLPQLTWRIPFTGGTVTAEADLPGRERAVFDIWARTLGLKVSPEKTYEFAHETHLRAEGKVDGVYLFLRATIDIEGKP